MLEVVDLVKNYGKFRALNDLNITVSDGIIYGFVGPNGAGKTTAMKIMSGLLTATSGSVFINGENVVESPRALREKIGYMPDFFGVYDNLKVDEYMDFYAGAYYIPYKERGDIIGNLLELVDLSDKRASYVDSLSRGMKQRLCLARSLVHDPEIIILDEPASGLDPRARVEMKETLKHLQVLGKTVIISSHILPELAEMCTEIGIINNGALVSSGSINDIMRAMTKKRVIHIKPLEGVERLASLLSEIAIVSDIRENIDNVEFEINGDDKDIAGVTAKIVGEGIDVVFVKEKEGNLEDIFMRLTKEDEND
ncbi:MAG: ABC transporter ATP-binding protein [Clostridiales bacterium]|jgi:ABC-2 type transport system ATP-binding protein|nr:ABC transporter ATP-binding protein [Clostridiales bacterium]